VCLAGVARANVLSLAALAAGAMQVGGAWSHAPQLTLNEMLSGE